MGRQKTEELSAGLREAVKAAAEESASKADPVKQPTRSQNPSARFNMNHALMLEVFREPITFHPAYVEITGSVTAALLLSYACTTSDHLCDENPRYDGWFHKSQDDWMRETGLSRRELEGARRTLRGLGLLSEKRIGVPSMLLSKIDFGRLSALMQQQATSNWENILPAA